jgi:hypothetical protein
MRGVKPALFAGLAALALALILTVSRSPPRVAASNEPHGATVAPFWSTTSGASLCQAHEMLPSGSSAIRVWLDATAGPRVSVAVYSDGRMIAGGTRGSNWIGGSVTVPLRPLPRTTAGATICVSFPLHDETVLAQGTSSSAALSAHEGARALGGRMRIEYLRPSRRSWLAMAGEVARRMGLGRAAGGTWVALAALALLGAALALATRLLLRELA